MNSLGCFWGSVPGGTAPWDTGDLGCPGPVSSTGRGGSGDVHYGVDKDVTELSQHRYDTMVVTGGPACSWRDGSDSKPSYTTTLLMPRTSLCKSQWPLMSGLVLTGCQKHSLLCSVMHENMVSSGLAIRKQHAEYVYSVIHVSVDNYNYVQMCRYRYRYVLG